MRKFLLCLPLLAACTPLTLQHGGRVTFGASPHSSGKPATGALIGGTPPEDCGALALQSLVGQPLDALPSTGSWTTKRILRPGMAVTQDYSATRLDVRVDATERILSLTCG